MKMNKRKILIALGMIGSITIAQAQWAVTNVNDVMYFGPTGIFTQMMGKMNSAINATMASVNGTAQVAIAQQDTNMAIQDSRQRRSMGLAEIARRDNLARPTIESCAEVSKTAYKSPAMAAALRGGRRPGSGNAFNPTFDSVAMGFRSTADEQAAMLKNMPSSGTCAPEYGNIAGCSGTGPYVKGDILALGIKTNMKGANGDRDFKDFSMDESGYRVAKDYIAAATMYDAPRMPTRDQIQKNPSYLASYKSVITKLYAAQDAMTDVANLRMGNALPPIAKQFWDKESAKYTAIYGVAPPGAPSVVELLNLNVVSDYLLPEQNEDKAESARKRIALSNFIAWKQFLAQENTNILLGHILTQLTTPVNKAQLDADYTKTANMK